MLDSIPRQVLDHRSKLTLDRTAKFAARLGLSAYDAAYLELADRQQATIHSLDENLRNAASALALLAAR